MPMIPRCHPSPSITMQRLEAKQGSSRRRRVISSKMAASACCRSLFRRSSLPANSPARTASRVVNSSTTSEATSMRPAALMRGAMRNARSVEVRARRAGSSLDTCIRQRSPALAGRRNCSRPTLAKTRFSPNSGTASATVAMASIFRKEGRILARVRSTSHASSSACASLNATPAPHRCLQA